MRLPLPPGDDVRAVCAAFAFLFAYLVVSAHLDTEVTLRAAPAVTTSR